MKNNIAGIILVGLLWGGWPLITRWAGKTGSTGAIFLTLTAVIPIGLMLLREGALSLDVAIMWKLTLAGLMMGAGMVLFNMLVTDPRVDISVVLPAINASALLATVIGGICFFGEPVTTQKVLAVTLMIIGIVLLRPGG